ncbi:MAG: Isoquinoline 1-oxidoreductase subunit [Myxococcota bacterium]
MPRWGLLTTLCVACAHPAAPLPPAEGLRPVAAFDAIAGRRARSVALFDEVARVLTHPRCANCHPVDDRPRQGLDQVVHDPPVWRGPDDRGEAGAHCDACHQERNSEVSRVPGAPAWHLAPASMGWIGQSNAAICAQLQDPARNGGRTLAQIQEHLAGDALVAWGWAPGDDREPAPGSQAELAALAAAWIETGARCPEEAP